MLRVLVIAVAITATACGNVASKTPERSAAQFYAWATAQPSGTHGTYDVARHLLGVELFEALTTQQAYEAACARLVPTDVKPYMLDQSPFFLWPDRADAFSVKKVTINGDTARVFVQLEAGGQRWTDSVLLRRRGSDWVVLNIDWQDGGSVTQRLAEFAEYRCSLDLPE